MTAATPEGIVELPSRHSVDETVRRLEGLLPGRGIKLFGNPNAGTPLMQALARAAAAE